MDLPAFLPTTETGLLPCVGHAELYDHPDTLDQAADLCARCPVRTACDTWATEHAEWGTWAGRTDQDRGTPRREIPDLPRVPVRQPTPACGSEEARRRHIGRQEQCDTCDQAYADRIRADRMGALEAQHRLPAGPTRRGYRLHMLLGSTPCGPCRAAHAAEVQHYRAAA